jgi:hypothetical protein
MTSDLQYGRLGGALELRAEGNGARTLHGSFPYRTRAILSDGGRRGRPQKEEFDSNAFAYRVNDQEAEIHLLIGHDYGKPLASKLSRTLALRDTPAALEFEAQITPAVAETSHVRDILALIGAGLATGLSPGFRLPPERAVPKDEAEEFGEEPDNPSEGEHRAIIRRIKQALLFELSIVTAPAYPTARVEARARPLAKCSDAGLARALNRWRP